MCMCLYVGVYDCVRVCVFAFGDQMRENGRTENQFMYTPNCVFITLAVEVFVVWLLYRRRRASRVSRVSRVNRVSRVSRASSSYSTSLALSQVYRHHH